MEWKSGVEYHVGDIIVMYNRNYECIVDHKSNIFGNDIFDKNYWKAI